MVKRSYAVFGEVVGGMAVVKAIENTPTNMRDKPKQPQKIISVRMEDANGDYRHPWRSRGDGP